MTKVPKKEFSMNHIEGTLKSPCETSIFYQAWIPEREIKAVLIIVHGIGEHYCTTSSSTSRNMNRF